MSQATELRIDDIAPPAPGYWATAMRKLRRDGAAMTALTTLIVIILLCAAAPLYARDIAHTNPFESNLSGTVLRHGKMVEVLGAAHNPLRLGVEPIGPSWKLGPYMLGADGQGRDVAARMLYGGRNSLLVSFAAAVICLVLAALTGILAGFFGGWTDRAISWLLDALWAFPVFLLAISLSVVLIAHGIDIGPIRLDASSLALPITIIGVIYVPYVARPVRGLVLGLRQSEYVLAAIGIGAPSWRILWFDILPNVISSLVVFAPLIVALDMLTEAALSFLSIGVQPPAASWGTIIHNGESLIYTRPIVAIAPGLAIVITVLALNILGDGLRDALDPRAKLRN
ncbi:ABC transporter permease [Acidiphilium iwatense]|uniref:ABC transporter permease n=1 Tax=Acidiphilium iwatense TaxID=768198 RepID=A0ABS9DYS6_9PROT|nr:ABC transporter permease [Acidiphilium iwatense]MCF3946484.1 ABC transporter permease [Acidiphilium iwatense]